MNRDHGRATDSWQKAEAHLREGLAQDADASPMAIIHSSYDETILPSSDEARDALQAAADFLDICGARYGFRPIAPGALGD